ncbi:MAG: hypothetical protein GDA50_07890 [Alphaproteobacteria bacterium GM202ARS2]|nr:hypothetical protein [Alphaproteobacteria bacterium GM202ARS2]
MVRHLSSLLLFLASMAWPAQAETLHLDDGNSVSGTILRSIGNAFSIRLDGGGMLQIPKASVERVTIVAVGGGEVSGDLVEWTANIYIVLSADRGLIAVQDGIVSDITNDSEVFGVGGPNEPASSEHRSPKTLTPTM